MLVFPGFFEWIAYLTRISSHRTLIKLTRTRWSALLCGTMPEDRLNKPSPRALAAAIVVIVLLAGVLALFWGAGQEELLTGQTSQETDLAKQLETELAHDPANPVAYGQRASLREREGNWNAAVDDLRKVVELNPECAADFDFRLGVALIKSDQPAEGVKYLEKCLVKAQLRRGVAPATIHDYLADALLKTGRYKEAIAEYDRVLVDHKQHPSLDRPLPFVQVSRKAACYAELGDLATARKLKKESEVLASERQKSMDLTSLDARHQRAHDYARRQEYKSSLDDLNYCIGKDASRDLLTDRAQLNLAINEFYEAVRDCDRALKQNCRNNKVHECHYTDAQLRCLRANAYARAGRFDQAIESIGTGESFDELATRGEILYNRKDFTHAVKELSKALHLQKTAKLYYLRAMAQEELGHFGETVYDLEQMVATEDHTLTHLQRAEGAMQLKNYKVAVEQFTQAIQSLAISDAKMVHAFRQRAAARRELQMKSEAASDDKIASSLEKSLKDGTAPRR